MGNHRADVEVDSRDAETLISEPAAPRQHRGKRCADVPVVEAAAPVTGYTGKRRAPVESNLVASSLESDVLESSTRAPEPVHHEPAITLRAVDATIAIKAVSVEPVDAAMMRLVESDEIAPAALVAADEDVPEVERTVFVPRIRYDEPRTAIPTPRTPYALGESLRPLFAEDSRTDLPRITLDIATDFAADTTSTIPAIGSGRRSKRNRRRTSVPMLAGAAALLVAAGGAVATAQGALGPAFGDQLVAANAFTGASGVASVGTRGVTVSRDSNRLDLADKAATTAEQRTEALTKLDTQATGQDQWLSANQWTTPIPAGQYVLTGRFGEVSGLWATIHTGLDFACPDGTPIHAVASGTITSVAWGGAYGNLTEETLPDGTQLWYAHQSRFGATVGEKVTEGEVIGYVGATGNVTGPHVHLEVRPGGGDPVDPDAALRAHGVNPDAEQG